MLMLEQQSAFVRDCYERASAARRKADEAAETAVREDHLKVEARWLSLARSETSERLGRFLSALGYARSRMDVIPLFRDAPFEPPALRLMGEVFDAVCRQLGVTADNDPWYEIIGKVIVEQVRLGNGAATQLEAATLRAIGLMPEARAGQSFMDALQSAGVRLSRRALQTDDLLFDVGSKPVQIFVSDGATVSLQMPSDTGFTEIAMPDRGVGIGLLPALERQSYASRAMVVAGGHGYCADAGEFREAALRDPTLLLASVRIETELFAQCGRLAVCNLMHKVEQRMARWLMRASELSGGLRIPVTHERMSEILGVNRTTCSIAAANLRKTGAIDYTRGHIRLLDRGALRAAACRCYEA